MQEAFPLLEPPAPKSERTPQSASAAYSNFDRRLRSIFFNFIVWSHSFICHMLLQNMSIGPAKAKQIQVVGVIVSSS